MFCTRMGCPQPNHMNHYHCGRCTDPAVTSMLGHYSRDDQGNESFSCKEEYKKVDIGIPMSWNGTEGYFLSDDEYESLVNSDNAEYTDELETEVHNHRNTIDEARDTAYELFKLLDNAL